MSELTKREEGILGIIRYNDANPIQRVRRGFRIGRVKVGYERRSSSNLWGRFEITEAPARLCAWCPTPHWMSREDQIRNAAGAPTSHGMCDRAAERFMEDAEALGNGTT